ncbi:hypothetical protein ACTQ56_04515 [[Clostridium] aminophilum]|uniref:hypothetical protein n=1 Tax=[Clostridium] aminophilum TaxID=1526 RepID=UPI003F9D97E6
MINYSQIVKAAKPVIKQAGRFIKANPHYLIEGLLGGGLLASIGYNVKSENEHEKREELVKNQLKKDQAIIKDLSSKAEKVDKLEKCNELLMDALTKESNSIAGA